MATAIFRETIYRLVYAFGEAERFTQDSPVLPDVWAAFAERPGDPIDLLLTPRQAADGGAVRPAELARALRDTIVDGAPDGQAAWRRTRAATNRTTLVAALTLRQLVQYALPMSEWWQQLWADAARVDLSAAQLASSKDTQRNVAAACDRVPVGVARALGPIGRERRLQAGGTAPPGNTEAARPSARAPLGGAPDRYAGAGGVRRSVRHPAA